MRVKVKVYSALRWGVVGSSLVSIELEKWGMLQDFIDGFSAKYGEAFQERTKRDLSHTLKSRYFNLFVNGRRVKLPRDLKLRLKNNDEIVILQPVGGG